MTTTAIQDGFDLEALGLRIEPTASMLRGTQRVFQCSWCGTVVVVPSGLDGKDRGVPGTCPSCGDLTAKWWEQRFPIAGLHEVNLLLDDGSGTPVP